LIAHSNSLKSGKMRCKLISLVAWAKYLAYITNGVFNSIFFITALD